MSVCTKHLTKLLLLGCLLNPFTAQASEWTKDQVALAVAGTVLTVTDWGQTLSMERDGYVHHQEINPILGKTPSRQSINLYFPIALGLSYLVADSLPSPYRSIFLYTYVAVEATTVGRNYKLGLRMTF